MVNSSQRNSDQNALDIAEVARRTGLTSRALRFYKSRGLVRPLRSFSGRRYYGTAELERVHQIVTLKRAGLTIAQIEKLIQRRAIDLASLIDVQMAALNEKARVLLDARTLLSTIKTRIEHSEPIDISAFCSLIRQGEDAISKESDAWKSITDKYLGENARADFAANLPNLAADYDQAEYGAKWQDLGARIKAAMPMDPSSDQALGFVREWFELLKPFSEIATPAMWEGTKALYAKMDEWQVEGANPGFDAETFAFITEATAAAKEAGNVIGPMPGWMKEQLASGE